MKDDEGDEDRPQREDDEKRPRRKPIKLVAVRPDAGTLCYLRLKNDVVVLRDEDDEVIAEFDAAEADQHIQLPNIWNNRYILIDGTLSFEPKPETIKKVRELIDDCLGTDPEAAAAAMRRKGNRDLLIGGGSLVLGLILTGASFAMAPPQGTFIVMTGLIVVGLVEIIRGISWLSKARKYESEAQR